MNELTNEKQGNGTESENIGDLSEKLDQSLSLTLDSARKNSADASPRKMSITDFKLIKILGIGAYAKVILGMHIKTNKNYALKTIDKSFIEKEEKVHEVHVERIILSTFDHPNIIKLYYTFQNSKKLYFVLEIAEKGDLKHFIKSQSN